MEIRYNKIHEIVIEALGINEEKSKMLKVIGDWYLKFLSSPSEKASLHIPEYSQENINMSFNYVRIFSLVFKLSQKKELLDFKNKSLFNVFEFNSKKLRFIKDSTLDYIKKENDLLYWTNNIVTSSKRFLPVFEKNQIEFSNWNSLFETFKLFKIIDKNQLINYPIFIDLNADLCLSLSSGNSIIPEKMILIEDISWDPKYKSIDDAIELEEELLKIGFYENITFKYPYHKNIHSYLLSIGVKKFTLNFNSRFYYQNLEDDSLFAPRELDHNYPIKIPDLKLNVYNTHHSIRLFLELKHFKSEWQNYNFNKFSSPFPKLWFLTINQNISKEEWLELFKNDYPEVSNKPIINSIKLIIELLYELNWSKSYIEHLHNPTVLMPQIKGPQKRNLEKSIISFKNYLEKCNPNVKFLEHADNYIYSTNEKIIVLDAFNILEIVNIAQRNNHMEILVPDFLFHHYQPWLKYHFVSYQFNALLNTLRQDIDPHYEHYKSEFQKITNNVIYDTKKETKAYLDNYDIQESILELENIPVNAEDFVFNNSEEIEINSNDSIEKREDLKITITTDKGKTFILDGNTKILLQRSTLVLSSAKNLELGDLFLIEKEISSIVDKDAIAYKLSKIPESTIDFQIRLGYEKNIYNHLQTKGLKYHSEKYFNEKYVASINLNTKKEFILPRKKEYWKIICEFLEIGNIEMNQTWISYYGRKNQIEIQNIYKQILELCIDQEYLTELENPKVLNKIIVLLEEKKHLFDELEEENFTEIAKSITSAIINELSFFIES